MSDSRYVVIGVNKNTGEAEPVHPGVVSEVEAQRVKRALMEMGIGVTIWDATKWEEKVNAEQADLFCPICGQFKEDCSGHDEEPEGPTVPESEAAQYLRPAEPATPAGVETGYRDVETADLLDELAALEQERTIAAIDEEARLDAQVPDLSDPETQTAALELLLILQGIDFGMGSGNIHVTRMLTAIHNKLFDEWTPLIKED